MISDQIKQEISKQVDEKISSVLGIFSIPLKAQFTTLLFTGAANGTALTAAFNINVVQDRVMIVKALRIVPYYPAPGPAVDLYLDDGVTQAAESITNGNKIDRVFDRFAATGTIVNFSINDFILPIMRDVLTVGYPLETYIDNIFYKFDQPVKAVGMSVLSTITDDLITNNAVNPNVKVVVECYLI